MGIQFLSDLYNEGSVIPFTEWKKKGLTNVQYMKWRGLLSSIKKSIDKESINKESNSTNIEILAPGMLTYINKPLNILTSKAVYNHMLTMKYGDGTYIPRVARYIDHHDIDWSLHYKNAQKIPIDTKTREFQFKFLHDILATNFWLKKWHLIDSDECTFCKTTSESIIHLFWDCIFVQTFWADFNRIYRDIICTVDLPTVVCGSSNPTLCTLILTAKRYIYECKYAEKRPDIRTYICKINYVKNTEFELAKRNGKITQFMEKWEALD